MSDQSRDLIAKAAARAAGRHFYLARAIATFQELRRMDDPELAGFLRCSADTLARLRLCRRPDLDSPEFQSDVRQIVQTFAVYPPSLLQLLREVSSIEAMRGSRPERSTGFLMAARDKPPRGRHHDEEKGD
jgi:hypothetical protein